MAGVYKLSNCLDDVAKKRGRLLNDVGNFPKTSDEYQEVWDCMNRYISACLEKKKGINIANFCKIGYLQVKVGSNGHKWRPLFHLAESFAKNYNADTKKGALQPEKEQTPYEEFNFSKAAIKFSNHLQKDNVFCGIRYIVQAIGEAVSRGQRLEIDFEHGKLLADNRKTRFVFRAEIYSNEGVPPPSEAIKGQSYQPSVTFQPPSKDALKLRLEGNNVARSNLATVPEARAVLENERHIVESEAASSPKQAVSPDYPTNVHNMSLLPAHLQEQYQEQYEDSETASQVSEQSMYDPAKYKGPTVKQEKAHREAMDRYLTEMEVRAGEAVADRRQWEEHLERCMKQERDDLERKKALSVENQDFLQSQMDWNRVKRGHDRNNWIQGASAHEFPQFTEPDDAGLRVMMKGRQQQMREDLDLQVRTNTALKTMERNKERGLEYSQMVANKNELFTQSRNEHNAKEFEKRLLTDSWARDVRMKNIFKAIDNHTQAAHSNEGGNAQLTLDAHMDTDKFSDTSSVRGGFSTRGAKPRMGASMNLEAQKRMMKK